METGRILLKHGTTGKGLYLRMDGRRRQNSKENETLGKDEIADKGIPGYGGTSGANGFQVRMRLLQVKMK